jgi:methionyl-tRNA formyltransferase
MKLVFMGTPEFASAFLETLHKSSHMVSLVVTQPDRPKGRGQVLAPPPVKEKALELGIPVTQPASLKSPEFHEIIRAERADLLVVVAYRILPDTLFPLARFGAVNVHGSLLPKYRGAAPIQWAVASGDTETGVTLFQLDALIDHGKILAQERTPIGPEETSADVFAKLRELGQGTLLRVLDDLEAGRAKAIEQDHTGASPAPKLKKEDGRLDWSLPAKTLHDRIRAFNPYPICYALQTGTGKVLRIHASRVEAETETDPSQEPLSPGEVRISADRYPLVGTGSGLLRLVEVQWEGKPRMRGPDFLNGLRDRENLRFDSFSS